MKSTPKPARFPIEVSPVRGRVPGLTWLANAGRVANDPSRARKLHAGRPRPVRARKIWRPPV